MAVISGLVAFVSGAHPTASSWVDFALLFLAGAAVAGASSRATNPTVLWMTAITTLAAVPSWWTILAAAGFLLALFAAAFRLPLWASAASGGLAVQALLRLPPIGPFGTCSAIAAAAAVPVLISGYIHCQSSAKRFWRLSITSCVIAVVLFGGAAALALLQAAPKLTEGADLAQGAVQQADQDEAEVTLVKLQKAKRLFSQAEDNLQPWWVKPSFAIPVVGQHVRTASVAASAGSSLSSAAAETAKKLDGAQSLVTEGQVDVDLLNSYRPMIDRAAVELEIAERSISQLTSGWLIPPVRRQVFALTERLRSAAPAASTTAQILATTDGLLGVTEPRNYLVLATNPSETRELGGFVGGYVLIQVSNGAVEIVQSGKASELNDALALAKPTIGSPDFADIYGRYQMDKYFNNVTATPDFPVDAQVAGDAFAAATGTQVDGVILADPTAVAALLQLTGPVDIPAAERT
ncbi:MAG: DUF4012 domain-containing protein, partial [Microthrixaceae bacterium]